MVSTQSILYRTVGLISRATAPFRSHHARSEGVVRMRSSQLYSMAWRRSPPPGPRIRSASDAEDLGRSHAITRGQLRGNQYAGGIEQDGLVRGVDRSRVAAALGERRRHGHRLGRESTTQLRIAGREPDLVGGRTRRRVCHPDVVGDRDADRQLPRPDSRRHTNVLAQTFNSGPRTRTFHQAARRLPVLPRKRGNVLIFRRDSCVMYRWPYCCCRRSARAR